MLRLDRRRGAFVERRLGGAPVGGTLGLSHETLQTKHSHSKRSNFNGSARESKELLLNAKSTGLGSGRSEL